MPKLWPGVPPGATIHGLVKLDVLEGQNGKPIIAITTTEGEPTWYCTAVVADMIGSAGRGATLRWQDHNPPTGPRRG